MVGFRDKKGKYKMRLEYHVVTENKDMFEKQKCKVMWKKHKSKTERDTSGQSWNNLNDMISNIYL